MSCYGFVNNKKSTVILSYNRKLFDYYLSKGFFILENESNALRYVPLRVKQRINAENLRKDNSAMACYK